MDDKIAVTLEWIRARLKGTFDSVTILDEMFTARLAANYPNQIEANLDMRRRLEKALPEAQIYQHGSVRSGGRVVQWFTDFTVKGL